MKGPAKLSEKTSILITHEMAMWLDEIAAQGGFDGRSTAARSLLQTIMDEDIRENRNQPDLRVVP